VGTLHKRLRLLLAARFAVGRAVLKIMIRTKTTAQFTFWFSSPSPWGEVFRMRWVPTGMVTKGLGLEVER